MAQICNPFVQELVVIDAGKSLSIGGVTLSRVGANIEGTLSLESGEMTMVAVHVGTSHSDFPTSDFNEQRTLLNPDSFSYQSTATGTSHTFSVPRNSASINVLYVSIKVGVMYDTAPLVAWVGGRKWLPLVGETCEDLFPGNIAMWICEDVCSDVDHGDIQDPFSVSGGAAGKYTPNADCEWTHDAFQIYETTHRPIQNQICLGPVSKMQIWERNPHAIKAMDVQAQFETENYNQKIQFC